MKHIILVVFFLFSLQLNAKEINVFVASNAKFVIEELANEFIKENPQTKITITSSSSAKGYAQFSNGLKYDIMIFADTSTAQKIIEDGKAFEDAYVYAKGVLVAYSLNKEILSSKLDFLNLKYVKKVAIANPKLAPYGKAASEVINNIDKDDKLKSKIVLGDNVSQPIHFVDGGGAEIGFSALSLLIKNTKGYYIEVDPVLYTPIMQSFVLTNYAKNNDDAKLFRDFLLSDEAKSIFKNYGYSVEN